MVLLKPEQRYTGVQMARQGDQDTGMQLNSFPEEAFKRYLHIVSGSACHRTMTEGSVIADCKRSTTKYAMCCNFTGILKFENNKVKSN